MNYLSITETIKDADENNPNLNTRVMVNLEELKRLVRRAEMLNWFTPAEVSSAFQRYTAPSRK